MKYENVKVSQQRGGEMTESVVNCTNYLTVHPLSATLMGRNRAVVNIVRNVVALHIIAPVHTAPTSER